MPDFGHIHDILADAANDDHYSPEARESARLFKEMLNKVWNDGYQAGKEDH